MESLSYTHGADAQRGGVDITISLGPEEADALKGDLAQLTDAFDTALWALAMIRTELNYRALGGRAATANDFQIAINDVGRLANRLGGIHDMAVRRHKEAGGGLNRLAAAMDVSKSTAQSRRNAILERTLPTASEEWAVKGGAQDRSEHY